MSALVASSWWFFNSPINKPALKLPDQQPVPAVDKSNAMYSYMKGDEFDMGYIADMIAHHIGGLNMASQAKNRASDEKIRTYADAIITSYSNDVNRLMQWQQAWNYILTDSNNPHAGHAVEMSGLMTEEMAEMARQLDESSEAKYDDEFLNIMIRHHQVAVDMSKYADSNAKHQELKEFSSSVMELHSKQILQLNEWRQN